MQKAVALDNIGFLRATSSVFGCWACAISGTSGSLGFGSVSSEEIERSTLEIVRAGLHWSCDIEGRTEPNRTEARQMGTNGEEKLLVASCY